MVGRVLIFNFFVFKLAFSDEMSIFLRENQRFGHLNNENHTSLRAFWEGYWSLLGLQKRLGSMSCECIWCSKT